MDRFYCKRKDGLTLNKKLDNRCQNVAPEWTQQPGDSARIAGLLGFKSGEGAD